MNQLKLVLTGLALTCALTPAEAAKLKKGQTKVVSWFKKQSPSSGGSIHSSLSATGRYVVFASAETTLTNVPGNGLRQILRHDRETGGTVIASLSTVGQNQSDQHCYSPDVSSDGDRVVFSTEATNLAFGPIDNLGHHDVFVRYLSGPSTARASLTHDGQNADANCLSAKISDDGGHVLFVSHATNLVPAGTVGTTHAYVRDLTNWTIERVSVSSNEVPANSSVGQANISADGRYVVFSTDATNLGSGSGLSQVYVRDRQLGTTTRISKSFNGGDPNGHCSSPVLSADGRFVAFGSNGDDLIEGTTPAWFGRVYVLDRDSGALSRYTMKAGSKLHGWPIGVSSNGRYVLAASSEPVVDEHGQPVGELKRLHRIDAKKGKVSLASVSSKGKKAKGSVEGASQSANGKIISFSSAAKNLGKDKDTETDVFVRRP